MLSCQNEKNIGRYSKPHFLPPLLGPTSVADLVALEGLKTTTLHRVALRHTAILLSELSLHIVYITAEPVVEKGSE